MRPPVFCQYVLPSGETCGERIAYNGLGRPPKFCSDCVITYNIHNNAKTRRLNPDNEPGVADITKRVKMSGALMARYASRVERLAIGLASHRDPVEAAKVAGVPYDSDEELNELHKAALSDEYRGLRDLQPAAMTQSIMQTIALLIQNAKESAAGGGSATQIVASVKGLTQALELLTGGASAAYGDILIQIPGVLAKDAPKD